MSTIVSHYSGSRRRGQNETGAAPQPPQQHHHRVALLLADGNYDIERQRNFGDSGDFWTAGMVLGPLSTSNATTNNNINNNDNSTVPPNTDSYLNGPTAIVIAILGMDESDTRIRFRVDGIRVKDPSETAVPNSTLPPTRVVPPTSSMGPMAVSRSPIMSTSSSIPSTGPLPTISDFPSQLASDLPIDSLSSFLSQHETLNNKTKEQQ